MNAPLIAAAQLADCLNSPDCRVIDCRHQLTDTAYGERVYAAGHIPGAVFLHLDRDLSAPMTGHNGRHPLPDPHHLAMRLGAAGISRRTHVVVYDDAGGMIAGWLWWQLRWLGHDRVTVLDGGYPRWLAEGRAVCTRTPLVVPAVLDVRLRDCLVRVDAVLDNLSKQAFCLMDARSSDRFRGENETLDPVGGHIPGARNRFFRDNLDADGCFRPAAELRREFLALLAGIDPAQVVMMCGSGVSACHNLLAMELAGLHGARLYAGSWSEWCSDPARPVAR